VTYNKKLLFLCCAFSVAVVADSLAQPADPYETCNGIADPRARLACYDGTRTPAPPPVASPVPPAASRMPSSAMPPSPASLFGLRHAKTSLQRIMANVQWYSVNEKGKFTVGLDNGQVWRQFNDDTTRAKFSDNPQSNKVVIRHGFFESYDLKLNRMNALFRVERIK
jgi:hypothetical protein